jgi:hypothetical protein
MTIAYMNSGSAPGVMRGLPKTGMELSYHAGDAGAHQVGITWPDPRFTVQADANCVLDNLTGLVWAKNANLNGRGLWATQLAFCNALDLGGHTDWRLPNVKEMFSLFNYGHAFPGLVIGHPFLNVQTRHYREAAPIDGFGDFYWTSTTDASNSAMAIYFQIWDSWRYSDNKTTGMYFVWPVRGP